MRDDPSIAGDHELWRRVRPDWIVLDKNVDPPVYRPSSQVFQNYPGTESMSVLLGSEHGDPDEAVIGIHSEYSLASITAALARSQTQSILRAPEPDEPMPAHVEGKKTGGVRNAFARSSIWKLLRRNSP